MRPGVQHCSAALDLQRHRLCQSTPSQQAEPGQAWAEQLPMHASMQATRAADFGQYLTWHALPARLAALTPVALPLAGKEAHRLRHRSATTALLLHYSQPMRPFIATQLDQQCSGTGAHCTTANAYCPTLSTLPIGAAPAAAPAAAAAAAAAAVLTAPGRTSLLPVQ
jgi:hypothetical protein